jgi:adenine phosphoribosyltransferase
MDLENYIGKIPDFPKPGILFYDVSPLLACPKAWRAAIRQIATIVEDFEPDLLCGIESRGFLLSAPLALELDLGFTMIRKPGKLPGETIGIDYDLEYGSDRLEIKADVIQKGQKVVVLDDLLATGGTLKATIELVRSCGATVVAAVCLVELTNLGARDRLDVPVVSLMEFEG